MKNSTRETAKAAAGADARSAEPDLFAPAPQGVPPVQTRRKKAAKRAVVDEPYQIELFVPTPALPSVKDDIASIDIPLFSLTKGKDTATREYRIPGTNRAVRIIPSGEGCATVFDRDLLIYVGSHIVAALDREEPVSRTVVIESTDFLRGTNRGDGRTSFENILGMLRRLRGTTIETNIPTGKVETTRGFALIEDYEVLSEKTRVDKKTGKEVVRVHKFSVTVSKWFMNSWLGYEVVTLDRRYFSLSSPVKRRMYEVARKYCGKEKAVWKIELPNLAKKLGYKNPIIKLREDIREMMVDGLFEYRIALEPGSPGFAVVYTTDQAALHKWIMSTKSYDWWQSLEKEPKRRQRAAVVEVISEPDIEDTTDKP